MSGNGCNGAPNAAGDAQRFRRPLPPIPHRPPRPISVMLNWPWRGTVTNSQTQRWMYKKEDEEVSKIKASEAAASTGNGRGMTFTTIRVAPGETMPRDAKEEQKTLGKMASYGQSGQGSFSNMASLEVKNEEGVKMAMPAAEDVKQKMEDLDKKKLEDAQLLLDFAASACQTLQLKATATALSPSAVAAATAAAASKPADAAAKTAHTFPSGEPTKTISRPPSKTSLITSPLLPPNTARINCSIDVSTSKTNVHPPVQTSPIETLVCHQQDKENFMFGLGLLSTKLIKESLPDSGAKSLRRSRRITKATSKLLEMRNKENVEAPPPSKRRKPSEPNNEKKEAHRQRRSFSETAKCRTNSSALSSSDKMEPKDAGIRSSSQLASNKSARKSSRKYLAKVGRRMADDQQNHSADGIEVDFGSPPLKEDFPVDLNDTATQPCAFANKENEDPNPGISASGGVSAEAKPGTSSAKPRRTSQPQPKRSGVKANSDDDWIGNHSYWLHPEDLPPGVVTDFPTIRPKVKEVEISNEEMFEDVNGDMDKVRCLICKDNRVITKNSMSRHSKTHTKKGFYYCSVCGRGNGQTNNIKNHMQGAHEWNSLHETLQQHLKAKGIYKHVWGDDGEGGNGKKN